MRSQMEEDDQYLWPITSSPLFVPQSPSPSPSAFTYDNMRRRQTTAPTRPGSTRPTNSEQVKRIRKVVQPQSNSSSFASASGSAASSNSSTPQSLFSMHSKDSDHSSKAKGKRPAARSPSQPQGRRIAEPSTEADRPNKRRRVVAEDSLDFLGYTAFDAETDDAPSGFDSMRAAQADFDDLFHDDMEAPERSAPPVIDLTDDGPELPTSVLDILATATNDSSRFSSLWGSRSPSRLGSRTAPILIDDVDTPAVPRMRAWTPEVPQHQEREDSIEILQTTSARHAWTPEIPQQQEREDNIEVLQTIIARQQEEAVAAQTRREVETFTTFNNMTCVICMDVPRNLSMVPCGHVFCGACITEALRHSESRIQEHTGQRKAACPVCREPVWRSRKEHIVPILLKKGKRRQATESLMI